MAKERGTSGKTLADVAKAMGLSTSAVSLALRGKGGVSEATRARIVETAQAMGYSKAAATGPRTPRTARTVGLLIRNIYGGMPSDNVFYGPVMGGVEENCRARKLGLMLAVFDFDDKYYPVELPAIATDRSCDGLIVLGGLFSAENGAVLRSHPTVLVDAYSVDPCFDSVLIDNLAGAQTAVEHLISLGHRDIAILGSAEDSFPGILERRRGYERAIGAAGLSPHYLDSGREPPEEEPAKALAYLRAHPEVTAVFCCYDAVAMMLLRVAADNGIRIPEQLSVVGFDDIDLAAHLNPPLTTMAVDKVGMGRIAVSLLAHRMAHPNGSATETLVRTTLMKRGSSGPAPVTSR